ncbi:MAG: HEAT repeat domain-containing protein [Proteobacteria bacterium]|nr:HEAT repeat domain-containing protein [Pseudomonadota bacterium]
MPAFSEKDFLKELLYCLEKSDLIKAKALLQYTPLTTAQAQLIVVTKINDTKTEITYPLMELLFEMADLEKSVHDKLYEIIVSRLYNKPNLILDAISNKNLKNKSVYIRLAGDLKCQDAVPIIENILQNETDKTTIITALQSASALKSESSIPAIGKYIGFVDKDINKEAIHAIGELNPIKSVRILTGSLGKKGGDTDILIIETLAELKTQEAMDTLCEILGSQLTDIRNAALSSLIKLGERSVPTILSHLDTDNEDALIHMLTTLGHIGDVSALPGIQKILSIKSDNPNVRFAVFEAMGRLPSSKSAISLAKGLEDPVEQVRMAAAKAIDNNLSSVLVGGLKNIVESKDEQANHVVSALIDAGADNIFSTLLESDAFKDLATDYIAKNAHPDTKKHFISILESQNKTDLVQKIEKISPPAATGEKKVIYVVDDSKMMLKVYIKKLHEMGYKPITFEFPAEVLKTIKSEKPDLIITDLNMPVINGMQLSKTVRTLYSSRELPILMITTQSDFIGQSSTGDDARIREEDLAKAGVNSVLHKPFTDEALSATISKLISGK